MKSLVPLMLAIGATLAGAEAKSTCPPAGYDRARLEALKADKWSLPDDAERERLAGALVACLASPDPALRDGLAFEGLTHFFRAKALSQQAMREIRDELAALLVGPPGKGFARPFAAIVLAEVARADRLTPFLTETERRQLLDLATAYLAGVSDYRGFDDQEGWRHGVAHGADLLLQLSLNPLIEGADLDRIRSAVAAQIAPDGHSYTFGESARLARPILAIAQRSTYSEGEWSSWLQSVADFGDNPYGSEAALSRHHNVTAFLRAVFVNARVNSNPADDALAAAAQKAIVAAP